MDGGAGAGPGRGGGVEKKYRLWGPRRRYFYTFAKIIHLLEIESNFLFRILGYRTRTKKCRFEKGSFFFSSIYSLSSVYYLSFGFVFGVSKKKNPYGRRKVSVRLVVTVRARTRHYAHFPRKVRPERGWVLFFIFAFGEKFSFRILAKSKIFDNDTRQISAKIEQPSLGGSRSAVPYYSSAGAKA